jgi:hypothetical protein
MTVDCHTFVLPAMELVYDQSSEVLRSHWTRIEPLLELQRPIPGVGDWLSPYLRLPGRTAVRPSTEGLDLEPGVLHDNPEGRLRAMDALGVDAQLISPALPLDVDFTLGSHVTRTIFDAYNRYVLGYCAAAPDRLQAVIQLHGAEPYWSVRQLEDVGGQPGAAAVTVHLPPKIAPDARDFGPIWRAIEEVGLPVVHRPGAGSPVWSPTRCLTHLVLGGVLERHPRLTIMLSGWPEDERPRRYLDDERVRVPDLQSHFPFGGQVAVPLAPALAPT